MTPKPALFVSETRLRTAWEALARIDPDAEMSAEDAERFLAQFVDREAALELRDEYADFVRGMEAFAAAKQAQALQLSKESGQILEGLERMKASTVRLMQALEVDELRGHRSRLQAKTSPGSVEVVDEDEIPGEYFRVAEDEDWLTINVLLEVVHFLAGSLSKAQREHVDVRAYLDTVADRVAEAQARRRAVDKNKIRAAWKEAGGHDALPVPVDQLTDAERALVRARNKERGRGVGAALATTIDRPVVPGARKVVTHTLKIS